MLANQLNVLLAQRQLSIKQVVNELGISRSSISNIVNNPSANVSTETINKLCNYLGITPSDFFIYAPYEFSFKSGNNGYTSFVQVTVSANQIETLFTYTVYLADYDLDWEGNDVPGNYDFYIRVTPDEPEDTAILPIYKKLAPTFQTQLTSRFISETLSLLKKDISVGVSANDSSVTLSEFLDTSIKNKMTIAFDLPWKRTKMVMTARPLSFNY